MISDTAAKPPSRNTRPMRTIVREPIFMSSRPPTIDARTQDGFVFRVDMRLRPYGDAGALSLNFDAMQEYYQDQGRDWERYAMIKARVIAGDRAAGEQLLAALRPFTYRRYIDFSAIESLRGMKAMINREVQRRGKHQHRARLMRCRENERNCEQQRRDAERDLQSE